MRWWNTRIVATVEDSGLLWALVKALIEATYRSSD
jgi:hypothetical protein